MTDEEIAKVLLYMFNLDPHDGTKYEQWDLNGTEHVFRFANLRTPTRLYVKFEEPIPN